jgi:hypothetical protein
MCSLTMVPGTEVAMGRKVPRTSSGAWGLGSQVSSWLWPPLVYRRRTDFALPKPGVEATAAAGAASGGRNAPGKRPNPPIRSHSRRLMPPGDDGPFVTKRSTVPAPSESRLP